MIKLTRIPCTLFLVLMALFVVSGCDDSRSTKNDNSASLPKVSILLYKADDTYVASVAEAMRKLFLGRVELEIFDGKADPVLQAEQFDAAMDANANALIINLVDPKTAGVFMARARNVNIPIIFFNREPDLETMKSYPRVAFVGTVPEAAGQMQGDLIAMLFEKHPEYDRNHDGIIEYIMFYGETDNPEAVARTEHSVRRAMERGVHLKPLGTYFCSWDATQAEQAMQSAWPAYGQKLELIISNNDTMALGAIKALNRYGFNLPDAPADKIIPVVGVDATEEAVEAIGKGMMSATVKQDSQAMAEAVAAMTLNALAGGNFLDGTDLQWDYSGMAVRIPYAPYYAD